MPLKISRETNYSKDKNLWHLSHEGLDLEDPANEPKYDEQFWRWACRPEKAPDEAEYVTIDFEKGVPVALERREDGLAWTSSRSSTSWAASTASASSTSWKTAWWA